MTPSDFCHLTVTLHRRALSAINHRRQNNRNRCIVCTSYRKASLQAIERDTRTILAVNRDNYSSCFVQYILKVCAVVSLVRVVAIGNKRETRGRETDREKKQRQRQRSTDRPTDRKTNTEGYLAGHCVRNRDGTQRRQPCSTSKEVGTELTTMNNRK